MTPDEMRKSSSDKIQQVLNLMKILHVRIEAKDKVDLKTGMIDKAIFWIDDENYPAAVAAQKVPPLGETANAPVANTKSDEKAPL